MSHRRLDVRLGEQRIGQLVERDDHRVELRFLSEYLEDLDRPVLGQFFVDHPVASYIESFPHGPLPRFFGHVLPEGMLRRLLCEAHDLDEGDPLQLLEVVGHDLPGAVVVEPPMDALPDGDEAPFEASTSPREDPEEPRLRFSLAGVQLKFSVVKDQALLTLPARGRSGDWIVKLANPAYAGLPENEWSMMEWARRTGLDVPECELQEPSSLRGIPKRFRENSGPVLAIRRYDRSPDGRVHQEDFAQVRNLPVGEDDKYRHLTYEKLGRLVRALTGDEGFDDFVTRLTMVVAIGNADAHLKNWSLVYPDGRAPRLSPLYDQVSTVAWPSLDQSLALKLAGARSFGEVDEETFRRFGERIGADPQRIRTQIRETLGRLVEVWKRESTSWPLLPEHREALRAHWSRVPLLRPFAPLDET